jgi:hypothetical protein
VKIPTFLHISKKMVLVQVQNVDRCKQKRLKMLVRVPMMDRYKHSAKIQRPWHCTNTESKHLSGRSDFACRRTAASAAESPPPRVLTKDKVMNTCAKVIPGTAPTLNRSTWSEAMAPSGARPGRVFADKEANTEPTHEREKKVLASSSEREGGKTKFKGEKAAGVYEGAEPPV